MAQKEGNSILVRVAKLLRLSIYTATFANSDGLGKMPQNLAFLMICTSGYERHVSSEEEMQYYMGIISAISCDPSKYNGSP